MADRRPPGFNVDLGFYDSDEVLSIPRRHRAAAIGIWTLAGAYSANKLTDGHVSAEKLKELGCTPAIRDVLMATKPEPLWVPGDHVGAIRFTRWTKWQRTYAEVKAYRDADAERKRKARSSIKEPPTSDDEEMSGRTTTGHTQSVRADSGNPRGRARPRQTETETNKENSCYLSESATEGNGRDSIAATPAADLVRRTIPREINSATQTALRLNAGALLKDGTPSAVVEEALSEWATKTGVGPGVLASMAADVVKRRNGHARDKPASKLRSIAELAKTERAREQAELQTTNGPRELE